MTNKEKIEKLEKLVNDAIEIFRMLTNLSACTLCLKDNEILVNDIVSKLENWAKLEKEVE